MEDSKNIHEKNSNSDEIPPITHNNTVYYSNIDKANVFKDFFASRSVVENEDDTPPDIFQQQSSISHINLIVSEVREVIIKLDKNKATGPHLIHNRLLIAACPVIGKPLTKLVLQITC